jgi:uncharacterized repeat protein (TIGR01451 family)
MSRLPARIALVLVGLLLIGWVLLPASPGLVRAAPLPVVTETSTAEPPPPPTSTPTDVPAVATNTPTAVPADTSTPTPIPTDDSDNDDDDPSPDPTDPPTDATPIVRVTPIGGDVADPIITKRASKTTVQVGDTVDFVITVTTQGNLPAENVTVSDDLPDFLALNNVSVSRGNVSAGGGSVVVTLGSVAPGEVITINISTRVVALPNPPGNINSAALVTTSASDDPRNNISTVELIADPNALASPTPTPAPVPQTLPVTADPGQDQRGPLLVLWFGLALIYLAVLVRVLRRT